MDENQNRGCFGKGIGIGFALGMFLTVAVCFGFLLIYTRIAGEYIVIGKHGVATETADPLTPK